MCTIAEASNAIEYEQSANCGLHIQAMQWAVTLAEQGYMPTPEIVLEIFARMGYSGQWREVPLCHPDWPCSFAAPEDIEMHIDSLFERLDEWVADGKCPYEILARFHLYFERVHPFRDCNGRVGRVLLCMLATWLNVGLIKLTPQMRKKYFLALHLGRIDLLAQLFREAIV